jgi:putative nucleotidyltransferase with HDIG domain
MRRTAAYALCIAEAAGLSEVDQRKVERVALFHDIGKIHAALFDIVHDDTKLSPEERAKIATHSQKGADVLAPLGAFYPELPAAVLAHHERWDGTGYPHQLAGERIPHFARIVSIADTFDAITHSRRYHHGEGVDRGWAVIAEGRGTQFDPSLVDVFLSAGVRANVERTLRHPETEARPKSRSRLRGRTERRTDEPESSVPDVRFRWRDASSLQADPPPDSRPTAASG